MEYRRLSKIKTFAASEDDETYFVGQDENGNDFHLTMSTFELLEWIDIEYLKEKTIRYIKNMKK
tara:strand:- start:2861 stop:3052 length:192 start_codon:yes stop_codon:yes gene_type:complete